jgi:hypothetical protein
LTLVVSVASINTPITLINIPALPLLLLTPL